MEKVVHLVLTYFYYDQIDSGEKIIEYRKNTEYYRSRILGKKRVTFHRGYTGTVMSFKIKGIVQTDGIIEIELGERLRDG